MDCTNNSEEARRLRELSEDLQALRDTLVRLSLSLHDHQFALGQLSGQNPNLDLQAILHGQADAGPTSRH